MPQGVVRELAFTGEPLPAERAKSLGLVNEIFETHEEVVAAALKIRKIVSIHRWLSLLQRRRSITRAIIRFMIPSNIASIYNLRSLTPRN